MNLLSIKDKKITVEVLAGSTIEGAVAQAIELANMLDVCVEFTFNSAPMLVDGKHNQHHFVEEYNQRRG